MIGLLGGTFDPIHCGHLDVARAARTALDLECVWLVPSRLPPHRAAPRASAAHRFAMTALAVADEPGMLASDIEMETVGPSYTIDTVDRLEGAGVNPLSVCLITGADAFLDIASWKSYRQLLDRCHFAVVSRPGTPVSGLPAALPALAGRMVEGPDAARHRPAIFLVHAETAPVSSTDVRQSLAARRALDRLLPRAVAGHIARHGLYADGAHAPAKGPA